MSAKHLKSPNSDAKPEIAGIPNRPFPLKSIIGSLVLIAAAIAAAALLLPKKAEAKDIIGLSAAEKTQVQRIEKYLNAIATLSSRFMQVTDTGQFAQGEFLMARPGRMRIDYDDPVPILIISDGTWVMYKDESLDQISTLPFAQVPASMFIGANVDFFGDDLMVTNFEDDAGALRLTLQRSEDPSEGSLTMVFEANPMQLKKWSVIDAQGVTTTVSLLGPRFGDTFANDLFVVENPQINNREK